MTLSHYKEPQFHRQKPQYTGAPGSRHLENIRIIKVKNLKEIKVEKRSKEKWS
jgi:hypothetical protein